MKETAAIRKALDVARKEGRVTEGVGVNLPDLPGPPTDASEEEFLVAVVGLAHRHGWLVHHQRPAWTKKGYRSAIQGDPGFPDLTMAKAGRLVFAELKSETGRTAPEQQAWIAAVMSAMCGNGIEMYVWRPVDWPDLVRTLGR